MHASHWFNTRKSTSVYLQKILFYNKRAYSLLRVQQPLHVTKKFRLEYYNLFYTVTAMMTLFTYRKMTILCVTALEAIKFDSSKTWPRFNGATEYCLFYFHNVLSHVLAVSDVIYQFDVRQAADTLDDQMRSDTGS